MKQTIICMKWGTRYSSEYVNRLWSMIKRHTSRDTRLVCYTDDTTDINSEVKCYPLPESCVPDRVKRQTWEKVCLWYSELEGIEGDVLFMDLDIVITGSIDVFFDYKPDISFCVIENWTQKGMEIGNTSIFRFRVGSHSYLADYMKTNGEDVLSKYRIEQIYISKEIKEMEFWPREWCASFKHTIMPAWPLNLFMSAQLPNNTKIVCFTGKPDPDEARDGIWKAPWYKKCYKYVRPTPWIAEHWR